MHDFCLFDTSPDFMLQSFLNRQGSILFPEIFHFSHMPAAFRIKPAILHVLIHPQEYILRGFYIIDFH